MPRLLGPI
ncbi:Protein of unknown function [Pyronema omphalodes CBS 100304]|uniref:Uncharacterized protein n=1 Tax=Pyronema omphalodes (strain CBS 100304) TaxID=1076935 RepID=U4LS82_PYROM|nr:Protein of unknown function [Pyronema omphalodes CBS 100304]